MSDMALFDKPLVDTDYKTNSAQDAMASLPDDDWSSNSSTREDKTFIVIQGEGEHVMH